MVRFAKNLLLASAGAYALLNGASADASAVSTPINVTARYQATCNIVSVNPIVFGVLPPGTSTTVVVQMRVQVSCTAGTVFGVWLPLSANANGAQRRMASTDTGAIRYIYYNLYSNYSASSLVPTAQTSTGYTAGAASWVGNYAAANVAITGEITSGQALTAGHYEDIVIVNVSY